MTRKLVKTTMCRSLFAAPRMQQPLGFAASGLVVQPRPLLQQIVIKDVPAVSADEARKSHSKQRVQCPVRRCTQSLLRGKLKKHIEGQHARRVAIVVVPTHASVHNMEAAALGPDEADERAEVRKTRLRLAGTCQ